MTELTSFGTMSLGTLVKELCKHDGELTVFFDFGGLTPKGIDGYRGYYEHLALGFNFDRSARITVDELVKLCSGAAGTTFTGWKGGEYLMDEGTPVWVSNRGNADQTAIVGVRGDEGWRVIINTAFVEA